MQKFLKYALTKQFPDLNIICDEELADSFRIQTSSNIVKEGTHELITISTDAGITHDFLKWKYDYSDFVIDGDISEQNIKDRIRIENGYLVIDDPQENASWSVTLKLTAYPIYYTDDQFDSIPAVSKPDIILTITAKKIEDISLKVKNEVPINSKVEIEVTPIPVDSTKLKGARYTYSTTTPELIAINVSSLGTEIITKKQGQGNVTVTLYACNNTVTKTNTVSFNIYDLRPMCFVIDQRWLGLSDPVGMVSENCILGSDGTLQSISNSGADGNPNNNTLTWLRQNTHAYVGRYTGFSGVRLKQLDDTTRKKFADSTSSVGYISNESGEFDVWMKINSDVYIKTEPWIPIDTSVPDTDYVLVTIARELPVGEDETKWEKFSQYNLYGVYQACRINNRLYSLSGKRPVNNISQIQSKSQARARGNGFKIVDYKFSKFIAFLFYGYYSTLDSQTQLGYGTTNVVSNVCYPKITGQTDDLAGVDTDSVTGNGAVTPYNNQIIAGEGSDIKSNNFWHLENIQGDLFEWLDDMMVMQAKRPSSVTSSNPSIYLSDYVTVYGYPIITKSGKDYQLTSELLEAMNENQRFITITDIHGNITRIIQHGDFTNGSNGYIKKMCFGDHADIIAKEFGASPNTGFCDSSYVNSAGYVARRSFHSVNPDGGIGCLYLDRAARYADAGVGSRLLYEGSEKTIHIIDDATESL
ncbi:MAG: hypothetical protein ACI4VC_02085 [Clostridia bacterium]